MNKKRKEGKESDENQTHDADSYGFSEYWWKA